VSTKVSVKRIADGRVRRDANGRVVNTRPEKVRVYDNLTAEVYDPVTKQHHTKVIGRTIKYGPQDTPPRTGPRGGISPLTKQIWNGRRIKDGLQSVTVRGKRGGQR